MFHVEYWELKEMVQEGWQMWLLETSEGEKQFPSAMAFNSIYPAPEKKAKSPLPASTFQRLVGRNQREPVQSDEALFMDFRVEQKEGLSFVLLSSH
jgi:hypothetical protein